MISKRDCIAMAADCGLSNIPTDAVVRLCALVAQAEQEACAKLLDEMAAQDKLSNYYAVAARAIRARGES